MAQGHLRKSVEEPFIIYLSTVRTAIPFVQSISISKANGSPVVIAVATTRFGISRSNS